MQPSTPVSEKKPFWKITVPKLPGSIKPVGELTRNPASPISPSMSPSLKSAERETAEPLEADEHILPDISDAMQDLKLSSSYSEELRVGDTDSGELFNSKRKKFWKLYQAANVDLDELQKLSWSGIPSSYRPWAWKLLMGYLPLNKERRQAILERKRKDYLECVAQYFGEQVEGQEYSNVDHNIFHQIKIDVPRTNPDVPLYQSPVTRKCLERILYVWTIRHPASGYVQGINDLVTPFFTVFLSQYVEGDPETCKIEEVPQECLSKVEADAYWCLSKLVDGISDSYTTSQPGIQRQVYKLKELVLRIDATLHDHLQGQGIEFIQFSFRWMNCLLMRETSLRNIIRMWDTYMAEGVDGYSTFHLYVCAAFLISWTKEIKTMDFAELMLFLQNPPSQHWGVKEIEMALSQAFMWMSLFQNAQSHLH